MLISDKKEHTKSGMEWWKLIEKFLCGTYGTLHWFFSKFTEFFYIEENTNIINNPKPETNIYNMLDLKNI